MSNMTASSLRHFDPVAIFNLAVDLGETIRKRSEHWMNLSKTDSFQTEWRTYLSHYLSAVASSCKRLRTILLPENTGDGTDRITAIMESDSPSGVCTGLCLLERALCILERTGEGHRTALSSAQQYHEVIGEENDALFWIGIMELRSALSRLWDAMSIPEREHVHHRLAEVCRVWSAATLAEITGQATAKRIYDCDSLTRALASVEESSRKDRRTETDTTAGKGKGGRKPTYPENLVMYVESLLAQNPRPTWKVVLGNCRTKFPLVSYPKPASFRRRMQELMAMARRQSTTILMRDVL